MFELDSPANRVASGGCIYYPIFSSHLLNHFIPFGGTERVHIWWKAGYALG